MCMEALSGLGDAGWFQLGDRDLATHLYRTGLLSDGVTLTEVTARLASALGVRVRVLPMTDDDVTTQVSTTDGQWLHYQEYLIRDQAAPGVRGVRFDGIGTARPAAPSTTSRTSAPAGSRTTAPPTACSSRSSSRA